MRVETDVLAGVEYRWEQGHTPQAVPAQFPALQPSPAELAALASTLAALTVALQGVAILLRAGVPTLPGLNATICTQAAAQSAPVPAQPGGIAPSPLVPISVSTQVGSPTHTSTPRATSDGSRFSPGVVHQIIPASTLEQDPRLAGELAPPPPRRPPPGVRIRTEADGTRVLTLNIHGAVPAHKAKAVSNQSIKALRDVASYINSVNPDVVLVQEVDDEPLTQRGAGVPHMSSVLAHLIGATDMAFTPGTGTRREVRHDSATYTRNGYHVAAAVNVDLPDAGDPARRSAGVLAIQPPDQRPPFTVISTHLSHMPNRAAAGRRHDQLALIDSIARNIEAGGSFLYTTPDGGRYEASGFPAQRIIFGGDLNTPQDGEFAGVDAPDRLLHDAGLVHANDLYGRSRTRVHIDHIYAHGFRAHSSMLVGVPAIELAADAPTDHPGYITDLS